MLELNWIGLSRSFVSVMAIVTVYKQVASKVHVRCDMLGIAKFARNFPFAPNVCSRARKVLAELFVTSVLAGLLPTVPDTKGNSEQNLQ